MSPSWYCVLTFSLFLLFFWQYGSPPPQRSRVSNSFFHDFCCVNVISIILMIYCQTADREFFFTIWYSSKSCVAIERSYSILAFKIVCWLRDSLHLHCKSLNDKWEENVFQLIGIEDSSVKCTQPYQPALERTWKWKWKLLLLLVLLLVLLLSAVCSSLHNYGRGCDVCMSDLLEFVSYLFFSAFRFW